MIEKKNLYCNKECCIELLVWWMRKNGTEASVGKLKEALERVKLKNVADNLISGKQEINIFSSSILANCPLIFSLLKGAWFYIELSELISDLSKRDPIRSSHLW